MRLQSVPVSNETDLHFKV